MEIALEKLPLEERVLIAKRLIDSIQQDNPHALTGLFQSTHGETSQIDNAGEFDEFFGVLKSDKAVTLDDMDKAIASEGGRL